MALNTTAAKRGWSYDKVNARLSAYANGTELLRLTPSTSATALPGALTPITSNGGALGSASLMWADLFLADGAVVNFNNSNVTLTHAANALTLVGGSLTSGDTNGVDAAAARTMLYGWYKGVTTAVTGTGRGVRGNARITVASANGTIYGGDFQCGNGSNATATDGVDVGTAFGAFFGLNATTPAASTVTFTDSGGFRAQIDANQGAVNFTTLYGGHIRFNTDAGGTMGTISAGYGLMVENEAVGGSGGSGTGAQLTAAFAAKGTNLSGGIVAYDCIIDSSGATTTVSDTDKVLLWKFKRSDGTTIFMRYDTSDNALAFATS